MFIETAALIEALLADAKWQTVLNAGSGTEDFFVRQQPYIFERVMAPLLQRGNILVNLDLKGGGGVHLAQDVETLDLVEFADVVLCCSLLEHVARPQVAMSTLFLALKQGGRFIAEVPASYPPHPDPIDNGLRLATPAEWDEFIGALPLQRTRFELVVRQNNPAETSTLVVYEKAS